MCKLNTCKVIQTFKFWPGLKLKENPQEINDLKYGEIVSSQNILNMC